MKLPISLLSGLVETQLTPQGVGDLLTMAGFELEGIETVKDQAVLDIKVMANRGDGLSALGLAREILARDSSATPTALYHQLSSHPAPREEGSGCGIKVSINTPDCTRFACRVIRGVKNGASPDWLRELVEAAGMRPISLLVDLTNLVMLEVGHPMHAYDLAKLASTEIVVRAAREGERLQIITGEELQLNGDDMVIATPDRAVGLAGVMGGAETEVDANTTEVLLEAAHFAKTRVRKCRKQHGLNTEASYRFERSVDPEGVNMALDRLIELYCQIIGASTPTDAGVLPGGVDQVSAPIARTQATVRVSRAEQLLGTPLTMTQAIQILTRLGFDVRADGDTLKVGVPTWRPDITREEDLVEELGRVHGYDEIPETPIRGAASRGGVFGVPRLADLARAALVRCGFDQVINHTMRDRHPLDFSKEWRVGPRNPHSPELALLRDSLLPGLAECAIRNGGRNVHLFEIGQVFVQGDFQLDESPEIALLSTGRLWPVHWQADAPSEADFFSLKGVVEELAGALSDHIVFDYPRDPDPRFHPTRQAGVLLDEGRLWAGTVGQIHPDVAAEVGLPETTVMAELDLLVFAIQDDIEHSLREFSRNPAIRRDIAVIFDQSVAYKDIELAVASAAGPLLEECWVFDRYVGPGVEEGKHSLGIALQLRKLGGNLTDQEANEVREATVSALQKLGGQLR